MGEAPQPSRNGARPLRVSVLLDGGRIDGCIHVQDAHRRFSDVWESVLRDQRAFLAMTDATASGHGEDQHLGFVLIDRADVRVIYPAEESVSHTGASRKMELRPLRATLLIEGFRVEGTIHVEPGKPRFSDAWEALLRDRRPFIVVTDAYIRSGDGRQLAAPHFLAVEKGDIQAVFPSEEEGAASAPVRRLARTPVRAMLVLDGMKIEGTVHLEPGVARFSRFSDTWDALVRERRSFIAVTDASIWGPNAEGASASAPFVAVDKSDVRAVYPVE